MSAKGHNENVNREGDPATSKTGSQEQPEDEMPNLAGVAAETPDMNLDPLAGAMDQGSAQTDTLEHAVDDDTGVSARNDPAGSGGPASRNTSAPAGREIGQDEPTEGTPDEWRQLKTNHKV